MVDQALEYKSLLNKVHIMIEDVNKLGIDTKKYDDALKAIINEVESTTKISKSKWGNRAEMLLICDYANGIKKLRMLVLELSEYEVYFKVMNSCEYLLMKIDKLNFSRSNEEVENYAKEIIEALKSIKLSSTIHYSDERKIVEKIYTVAYKIIKLEIITSGNSKVYEYVKNYDIDTYFLDRCIRKDFESLNLEDKSNENIKLRLYELSRKGLGTNYFDIELIKMLMCNSGDIDLKDNIIKELNNLQKDINNTVLLGDRTFSRYKYSLDEQYIIFTLIKKYRREILERIVSSIVSLSIFLGGFLGVNYLAKKDATSMVYPKTTTTYSDANGKEVKEGYSNVEDKEQNYTYIKVYSDWYDKFWEGTVRDVNTYDVSDVNFSNIEDYLINLNYTELESYKETVLIEEGDNIRQKGYTEVEQVIIDKNEEKPILDKGLYNANVVLLYTMYVVLLAFIEFGFFNINKRNRYIGITHNLYQLLKYNMIDYKEEKFRYKRELKECKSYLNRLLEEINKYEELKNRFDKLYNQNKYLLDNPEELLSELDTLSLEINKEEIKCKLKSLKRY